MSHPDDASRPWPTTPPTTHDRPGAAPGAPNAPGDPTAPRTVADEPARPAPRTTRDQPATPRTTHDQPAAPRTTRDDGARPPGRGTTPAPRTTRDPAGGPPAAGGAGAPPTVRDQPTATGGWSGARTRVNLPGALIGRFVVERDLGSGGEADLLLAHGAETGEQVVIRRYRSASDGLAPDVVARLQQADPQHVIRLIESGRDAEASWEVLEYARWGSLAGLRAELPGPWPQDLVTAVLTQVTAALDAVHALQLVHRDIKPDNLLVRERSPLDLVLSDFGLTRRQLATRQLRTTALTAHYAAPEATHGLSSAKGDWWSLGMLILELFTGRHPYERPGGGYLDDRLVMAELASHDPDLTGIEDRRWQLLCLGLLTRAPEQRWAGEQVWQWLAGQDPQVFRGPAGGPPHGQDRAVPSARRADRPYVFAGIAYQEPAQLAVALRERWGDAVRVMAGQASDAPPFVQLREWLRDQGLTEVADLLGRRYRPEPLLVRLLMELEPGSGPVYRGWALDRGGLVELITTVVAGNGTAPATQLLVALLDNHVLPEFDGLPGCEGYGLVDSRWRALADTMRALAPPGVGLSEAEWRTSLARLLAATLSPDAVGTRLTADAQAAAADPRAQSQEWFRRIAATPLDHHLTPARDALVVLCAPRAAAQTEHAWAEQESRRRAAEDQARRARQYQQDTLAATGSLIAGVLSLVLAALYLGVALGPLAIYLSIRARRSLRGNRTANWGLLLGILGFIVFWLVLGFR